MASLVFFASELKGFLSEVLKVTAFTFLGTISASSVTVAWWLMYRRPLCHPLKVSSLVFRISGWYWFLSTCGE